MIDDIKYIKDGKEVLKENVNTGEIEIKDSKFKKSAEEVGDINGLQKEGRQG
jgi:hypothetical protein